MPPIVSRILAIRTAGKSLDASGIDRMFSIDPDAFARTPVGVERAGVEHMFGIPGGVTIPIFDALVTTGTKIKFVLTRHEQGACHMADGYARATGKPAVVCATSGPGRRNSAAC